MEHQDQSFELLTMHEVAKLLQCSKAHVSNMIAGRIPECSPIPALRPGRRACWCVARRSFFGLRKTSEPPPLHTGVLAARR
jgi:hypothetical protein